MTVSGFSVIMSIACSSVILVSAGMLVSRAKKVRRGLVLLIIMLGFIRLALPIDLMYAKVVRSWHLYPYVLHFTGRKIFFGLTLVQTLGVIWLGGSIITFCGFFQKIQKLKWVIEHSVPVIPGDHSYDVSQRVADHLGYHGKMHVNVTKDFSTAVSAGILSPRILIPNEMLAYPEAELAGVIKHELTHYLRRDVGKQWTLYVLQCIFWWNPAVHYLKRCVVEMLEMECDERTCQGMSDEERIAYLETMKKVLQSKREREFELGMGYGKNHSAKFMERRFREVLDPVQRYSVKFTGLLATICVLLFLASYMFVIQSAGMPRDAERFDEEMLDDKMLVAPAGESEFLLKVSENCYYYVSELSVKAYLTKKEIEKPPYVGLPIYIYGEF